MRKRQIDAREYLDELTDEELRNIAAEEFFAAPATYPPNVIAEASRILKERGALQSGYAESDDGRPPAA